VEKYKGKLDHCSASITSVFQPKDTHLTMEEI